MKNQSVPTPQGLAKSTRQRKCQSWRCDVISCGGVLVRAPDGSGLRARVLIEVSPEVGARYIGRYYR
jgi:hypothetical protein